MPIHPKTLPTAGPFDLGIWNGRELIVTHRRWFPAILCFTLAAAISLWVLAAALWPNSNFVPDPDGFIIILSIAGVLGTVGCLVALWARRYAICPAEDRFIVKSGLPGLSGATPSSINPLWIQVHPLEIRLQFSRIVADWTGFAIVVHTQPEEGVIIAAAPNPDAAAVRARARGSEMRVRIEEAIGAPLTGFT
ncbi:MAG: hypothetical protein KF805_13030 [Phycisphaeraceae bacterium]|nr:hypothetical protein [Phycisphaeraceae bacterium]